MFGVCSQFLVLSHFNVIRVFAPNSGPHRVPGTAEATWPDLCLPPPWHSIETILVYNMPGPWSAHTTAKPANVDSNYSMYFIVPYLLCQVSKSMSEVQINSVGWLSITRVNPADAGAGLSQLSKVINYVNVNIHPRVASNAHKVSLGTYNNGVPTLCRC